MCVNARWFHLALYHTLFWFSIVYCVCMYAWQIRAWQSLPTFSEHSLRNYVIGTVYTNSKSNPVQEVSKQHMCFKYTRHRHHVHEWHHRMKCVLHTVKVLHTRTHNVYSTETCTQKNHNWIECQLGEKNMIKSRAKLRLWIEWKSIKI